MKPIFMVWANAAPLTSASAASIATLQSFIAPLLKVRGILNQPNAAKGCRKRDGVPGRSLAHRKLQFSATRHEGFRMTAGEPIAREAGRGRRGPKYSDQVGSFPYEHVPAGTIEAHQVALRARQQSGKARPAGRHLRRIVGDNVDRLQAGDSVGVGEARVIPDDLRREL